MKGLVIWTLLAKELKLGKKEVRLPKLYTKMFMQLQQLLAKVLHELLVEVWLLFFQIRSTPLNKVLTQLHNIDGLERVEQRQLKKLLSQIYGGGKHPELYAAFNKKINEYAKIKDSLKGHEVRLNLDHPLSVKMIRQLKLGKDALLNVEPITQELLDGC